MKRAMYVVIVGILLLTLAGCNAAADQPKPTPAPTVDLTATKEATSLQSQSWLAKTSPQSILDTILHSTIPTPILPMGGVVTRTELSGDMNFPLTIDVDIDNSASGVNHYEAAAFLTISSGWTTSIRYRIYANANEAAGALIKDAGTGPMTYTRTTIAGSYPAIVTNALPMGVTTNYGVTVGQIGPILVSATASYESYNFEAPNESPMTLSTEMVEVGIHYLEQLALNSDRSTPASPSPSQDARFAPGEKVVTNDYLNLRNTPSFSGNAFGRLSPGTELTVISGPVAAENESWYQIQLNDGSTAWVVSEGLDALH